MTLTLSLTPTLTPTLPRPSPSPLTGDGWEDVLFAGMDSVGVGVAPERSDFNGYAIYFP